MKKIGIIGAGSWGTALGLLLCNNGHDVTICSENEKEIESLKEHREHLTKLPGVKLPDEMKFTCDVRGPFRTGHPCDGKSIPVRANHM